MAFASLAARCRGSAHERRGEAGQDAIAVVHGARSVVLIAADGAGSACRGGAGAALACRTVARAARRAGAPASRACLEEWAAAARTALHEAAARHALAPRDLATTLVLLAADEAGAAACHIGDGAAVVRTSTGWHVLSAPRHGDYAGQTHFLTDDAPLAAASLAEPVSALAVFTDGLERLVLDLAAGTAHAPFFQMLARPLADAPAGRDTRLPPALRQYLASEAVRERTDDDVSIALAVRA